MAATPKDKIKALQAVLSVKQDGFWGGVSQSALDALLSQPREIAPPSGKSGKGWEWLTVKAHGEDLVIENATVTAFGGDSDSMDSGETASGINTKGIPDILGCALPMRRDTSKAFIIDKKGVKREPILRGSPIPKLPWGTRVQFTDPKEGTSITVELIDEGPAGWTKHHGDLTIAAARHFDKNATANSARIPKLTIRILGAAKLGLI